MLSIAIPRYEMKGLIMKTAILQFTIRARMLELGIKFAPTEVAAVFSFENLMTENLGIKTFRFHKNLSK